MYDNIQPNQRVTVEVIDCKTQLEHQREEERKAQEAEMKRLEDLKLRKQRRQRLRELNELSYDELQEEDEDEEEYDVYDASYDVHRNDCIDEYEWQQRNQTDNTKLRISLKLIQVKCKDGQEVFRPTYRQDHGLADERQPKQKTRQQATYSRRAAFGNGRSSSRHYSRR